MPTPKSRWFRVTAERFDWIPRKGLMKSFKRGQVGYEPMGCVTYGLSIGAIETIAKPKNAKIGKDGKIEWDGN
ncbi:hypothetical protein [Nitratireductor sp. GCM10026969]|uniref:hypothetical protein n=1 Tax=Nitratireductor sp. GCM10026969 TaxID=3252645 RepID=UPI00360EE7BD